MHDPHETTPEPAAYPIDGILDLHTFQPQDAADVVRAYLAECRARGITDVRIIHGKGKGVLKTTVERVLRTFPGVRAFGPAMDASGWGATVVKLTKE